jgi:hypothetical protein
MTASYQTAFLASSLDIDGKAVATSRFAKNGSLKLFQVDIENFDNEVESYEIEARDYAHAAELAEERFSDIYNMNIYEIRN